MSGTDEEFHHENWYEALKGTAKQFEYENDDLESILGGNIGFHCFFVADGDDPTRGVQTAVYQALFEMLEEVHIDAELVEHNQGEVTPRSVAVELIGQIEYNAGLYLSDRFKEELYEKIENRIERNMEVTAGA